MANIIKYLMCTFIVVCINSIFLPIFIDIFNNFLISMLDYFGYTQLHYEYVLPDGFERYVNASKKPRFIVSGYTVKILYTKEEQDLLNYLEFLGFLISVGQVIHLYNILRLVILVTGRFNPDVQTIVDFLMYFW